MREIGTIYEFENGKYELMEDHIVPDRKKRRFILLLNLSAFLVLGIGFIITALVTDGTYAIVIDKPIDLILNLLILILTAVSFFIYAVFHEWLHGWAFRRFNHTPKNLIKFGIVWKSAMAFCISLVPVKVRAGRLSLMMPVYVVCIPIFALGIVLNNPWISMLSFFYLSGSVGDFYYMWKLRCTDKNYYLHEEMPTETGYEVGYLLFRKIEGTL